MQVTHTVTVTPTVIAGMDAASTGTSVAEYDRGTSFETSQPLSASATADDSHLPTPAPSQPDTRSGSSEMGKNIGATIAVIGSIIFLFLLYKYCRRSKSNSSDVELGHVRSTHSRERQGTNRSAPISHADGVDPVAPANAQNWQDSRGLRAYGYASGTVRPAGEASSFDISPSALAQAQGWDRPFGAGGFQTSRTYGGDGPSSPVQFPEHLPPRKPAPAARPVGKQRRDKQQTRRNISPVSPLAEDQARHPGPSNYSNVSPLDSPTVSGGRFGRAL